MCLTGPMCIRQYDGWIFEIWTYHISKRRTVWETVLFFIHNCTYVQTVPKHLHWKSNEKNKKKMRWKTCICEIYRSRGKSFPNLVVFSLFPDSPRDHRVWNKKKKKNLVNSLNTKEAKALLFWNVNSQLLWQWLQKTTNNYIKSVFSKIENVHGIIQKLN